MAPTLNRNALLAAVAAAMAGCTTGEAPKPNFPINRPADASAAPATQPAPAAEPAGEETPPQARPTSPVESRPIQPPPAQQQQQAQSETRVIAGGRVIDVEGPGGKTHTVKAGETVYRVALGFGVSPEEVARINGLGKQPWIIRPGQVLRGPGGAKSKAYVAVEGDTVEAVAQRFGVTPRALASANKLAADASLRAGQRLKLPAGYKDAGPQRVQVATPPPAPRVAEAPPPPVTRPAPPPPRLAETAPPPPVTRPSPPPAQPVAPPRTVATPPVQPATATPLPPPARPAPPPMARETPPATSLASIQPTRPSPPPRNDPPPAALSPGDAEVARLGRGRFLWPVRGEVISGYGPKAAGQRNDGVNIRAPAGEVVRAAATGDVVYAGDQVPGFGNLVLIKHADGWVSAYGHLSRVDVRIQERIAQGQQIGLIGASGAVSEPQLHFEIRYAPTPQDRARPLDPMLVLPR